MKMGDAWRKGNEADGLHRGMYCKYGYIFLGIAIWRLAQLRLAEGTGRTGKAQGWGQGW